MRGTARWSVLRYATGRGGRLRESTNRPSAKADTRAITATMPTGERASTEARDAIVTGTLARSVGMAADVGSRLAGRSTAATADGEPDGEGTADADGPGEADESAAVAPGSVTGSDFAIWAFTGTGWIETYRPSQTIRLGAYNHGVKKPRSCLVVRDRPGRMS